MKTKSFVFFEEFESENIYFFKCVKMRVNLTHEINFKRLKIIINNINLSFSKNIYENKFICLFQNLNAKIFHSKCLKTCKLYKENQFQATSNNYL